MNFLHFLHLVEVRFVGFGQFSDYEFSAVAGLTMGLFSDCCDTCLHSFGIGGLQKSLGNTVALR